MCENEITKFEEELRIIQNSVKEKQKKIKQLKESISITRRKNFQPEYYIKWYRYTIELHVMSEIHVKDKHEFLFGTCFSISQKFLNEFNISKTNSTICDVSKYSSYQKITKDQYEKIYSKWKEIHENLTTGYKTMCEMCHEIP